MATSSCWRGAFGLASPDGLPIVRSYSVANYKACGRDLCAPVSRAVSGGFPCCFSGRFPHRAGSPLAHGGGDRRQCRIGPLS